VILVGVVARVVAVGAVAVGFEDLLGQRMIAKDFGDRHA
jgi:hypothetical protein